MADNFEKKFCPEAIVKWYESPTNSRKLSMDAKKHLSAVGWEFYRVEKTNGYLELRYKSPNGKVYNSLKTACKGYMEEDCQGKVRLLSEGKGAEIGLVAQGGKEGKINVVVKGGGEEENRVVKETKQPRKRKISSQVKRAAVELAQPNFSPKRFKNLKEEKSTQMEDNPFVIGSIPSQSSVCQSNPRTILSWLIDNKAVAPLTKAYYRDKTEKSLKKGRITLDGINCDCCFRTFSLPDFEAHSGSHNHMLMANIILDDRTGRSLSDCQRQVLDSKIKSSEVGSSGNTVNESSHPHKTDDVCSVCLDGGELEN